MVPGLWRALRSLGAAGSLVLGLTHAQVVVLDNFNAGAATGAVRSGTSWVGNVTQNATTLTVGGAATDVNGWAATGRTIDATGMGFVTLTAQRDGGHAAPSVAVQFEDRNLNTQVFSVAASSVAAGTLTTINIPIAAWAAGFDPRSIVAWSIGGGGIGTTAFRMTFDQLALSATAGTGASVPVVSGAFGDLTRAIGQALSLAVTATGTAPLAYQWRKNGNSLAGATAATFTIASVTALDAGTYTCAVTNAAGTTVSGVFTVTVSATPATVTLAGLAATYSGAPRAVAVTTAPAGLAVTITYSGSTNAPTNAGNYAVVATVADAAFTGRAEGTLVIARAVQSIAVSPLPATLTVGTAFALAGTANSGGTVSFTVLSGSATLSGSSLTIANTAPVTLRATQAGDANYLPATYDFVLTVTKRNQSIDFPALAAPPAGTTSLPLAATASSGLPITFAVVSGPAAASGNTLIISGAGAVLVRATQAGNDAFNAAPQVDRAVEVLAPPPPPPPPVDPATSGRIVNLSILTELAAGETMTLGTVLGGTATTGTKPLLVRAAGPSLVPLGVSGVLPDPRLALISAATNSPVATNNDWGGDTVLGAAFARVAAFAYMSASSKDAAIFQPALAVGNYTVEITDTTGAPGVAIAELYDSTPNDGFTIATPRLINVSVLKAISVGATLTAGFVIGGPAARTVLIRAVGPGLVQLGVGGTMADPKLELFSGSTRREFNDDWGGGSRLAGAFVGVGAFALPTESKDAAILLSLPPGSYTAQASGVGAGGLTLVEIYEVP